MFRSRRRAHSPEQSLDERELSAHAMGEAALSVLKDVQEDLLYASAELDEVTSLRCDQAAASDALAALYVQSADAIQALLFTTPIPTAAEETPTP